MWRYASKQYTYFKCDLCNKATDCKVRLPLGVVMKLAMGDFDLDGWTKYCAHPGNRSDYDYSRLHGLNYCINPCNGKVELQNINLGRKRCHRDAYLTDRNFCRVHKTTPCFLAGRRMECNQMKVARLMIRYARAGKPAIKAYRKVNFRFAPVSI